MTEQTPGVALKENVKGRVLEPGDADYDEARTIWNGMIDRRPAFIVQCMGVDDVSAAVKFSRQEGYGLSVKGGGHSVAGNSVCDDGLMLDLSPMNAVQVDPESRVGWVQAGARWREVDHETQAHGLATTGGIDSTTGVGGLTLGGGWGRLARKHGLTIDNLRSVDIVTAEGESVHASPDENPELFWGLRGGGGNFGIATGFEFQLHEVGPEVLAGRLIYRIEDAADVLRYYRSFAPKAADEISIYAAFLTIPTEPQFPEELQGKPVFALSPFYAGDLDAGRAAFQPLREFRKPLIDTVDVVPYVEIQQTTEQLFPWGPRYYWKSNYFTELPDELIYTLIEYFGSAPTPQTTVFFEHLGGAVSRVDASSTAYSHREPEFAITVSPAWTDPQMDDDLIAWARSFFEAVSPFSTGGVYVNVLSGEGDERIKAAFGDNYHRLVELKREWDPENIFRMNQNIPPAG